MHLITGKQFRSELHKLFSRCRSAAAQAVPDDDAGVPKIPLLTAFLQLDSEYTTEDLRARTKYVTYCALAVRVTNEFSASSCTGQVMKILYS